jgi:hypothetical protein
MKQANVLNMARMAQGIARPGARGTARSCRSEVWEEALVLKSAGEVARWTTTHHTYYS